MAKYYYAVARGRQVGIYDTWGQCSDMVKGFQNARYKKFGTREEATAFIDEHSSTRVPFPPSSNGPTRLGKRRGSDEHGAPQVKTAKSLVSDDAPIVYTDGACSSNGTKHAKAGWGVYWGPDHPDNCCGPVTGAATNNRGELEAVKQALDQAIAKNLPEICIRTDSMLLIKSLDKWINGWHKKGWKTASGEPVKNPELLQAIHSQRSHIRVMFEHVRGHSGEVGNEAADELARRGAAMYTK